MAQQELEATRISRPIQLSVLWAAPLGCYVYGDLLSRWEPGAQAMMESGQMGPLGPVTQALLLGVGVFMSVPILMIALSVLLPAPWSRWTNVVFGAIYSGLNGLSIINALPYYVYLTSVSVILTLLISGLAWRWPRTA